jgi:hypothetical protein
LRVSVVLEPSHGTRTGLSARGGCRFQHTAVACRDDGRLLLAIASSQSSCTTGDAVAQGDRRLAGGERQEDRQGPRVRALERLIDAWLIRRVRARRMPVREIQGVPTRREHFL